MKKIAILMTCHNRKGKTIFCLEKVFNQKLTSDIFVGVYLVDDGSTDGTDKEVRCKFPCVEIIPADGTLFWNRGMHLAFSEASKNDYDFYLWLNDDTYLFPHSIETLLQTWKECCRSHRHDKNIIIGSTCDTTGNYTYGGKKCAKGLKPHNYKIINPSDKLKYADTMNGNIVLIPRSVFETVGNLEKKYCHSMGDLDYGFRAKNAGCNLVVCPGYQGICNENNYENSWLNQSLPVLLRLKKVSSKTGLPFYDWLLFNYRHSGLFFPFWTLTPYIKIILTGLTSIVKHNNRIINQAGIK